MTGTLFVELLPAFPVQFVYIAGNVPFNLVGLLDHGRDDKNEEESNNQEHEAKDTDDGPDSFDASLFIGIHEWIKYIREHKAYYEGKEDLAAPVNEVCTHEGKHPVEP